PIGVHSIARDITERRNAEARQALLVRELQHRTKNMLAVVQSIVMNTLTRGNSVEGAREAILGRLQAIARAQEFVASGNSGAAPTHQGFGSRLISAALPGTPRITFDSQGFEYTVDVPLSDVTRASKDLVTPNGAAQGPI